MVLHSSEGSNAFFTPQMPNEVFEFPNQSSEMNELMLPPELFNNLIDWDELLMDNWKAEKENTKLSDTSGGLTHPQRSQNQLNQAEPSEASYRKKSGRGRVKLTPDQIRERKKQRDCRYRQKLKRTAVEQAAECQRLKVEYEELNASSAAECKRLKVEYEELNAKYKKLKELPTCPGQLPAEAPQVQKQDTCIAQSTSKQLDHPSDSIQVSGLEMDLQNLHQKIPINAVAYATENQTGTCYDNTTIKLLMKEIDEDDQSSVCFSDFTGLDGERIKILKYSFPLSLRPVVERIIACYGDVSATSKMNLNVVESTFILFCASLKEMGDLPLEEVSKNKILKWRDTIKDALRINFKVDFAMDHLKKIVHAYIGLLERQKLENVAIRISKLEADLNAEKDEHDKICEQSKVYMDAADEFNGKPISAGLF